jgi:hypothetical protein
VLRCVSKVTRGVDVIKRINGLACPLNVDNIVLRLKFMNGHRAVSQRVNERVCEMWSPCSDSVVGPPVRMSNGNVTVSGCKAFD